MALSAWPTEERENWSKYADIAKRFGKADALSRDDYIKFRKEFFDQCHGKKPKIVFNRLVGLMFPKQFLQVPKEEDMTIVYKGLYRLGAFQDERDSFDASGYDEEGRWYDENTTVMQALKGAIDGQGNEYAIGSFGWQLVLLFKSNPSSRGKAVVKYGPPGTGKTFSAKKESQDMLNAWSFLLGGGNIDLKLDEHIQTIQFHPSVGYEDFMEGLRPFRIEHGDSKLCDFPLRLVNGSFKEFCRRAGRWEIDLARYAKGRDKSVTDLLLMPFDQFKEEHLQNNPAFFQEKHWDVIKTAHPLQEGVKLFEVLPPYVFIIDEINRADLSRVFGELMYCIENRGPDNTISTQYAALNDEETGMINVADPESEPNWQFFVPTNIRIVGTMNVIDRSVESFDFALRRRFDWERDDPDSSVIEKFVEALGKRLGTRQTKTNEWIQKVSEFLADGLEALNGAIKNDQNLGDDWQIGHAYFKIIEHMDVGSKKVSAIAKELAESIWTRSICPLLEEYLRGNGDVKKRLDEFHKKFLMEKDKRGKSDNKSDSGN